MRYLESAQMSQLPQPYSLTSFQSCTSQWSCRPSKCRAEDTRRNKVFGHHMFANHMDFQTVIQTTSLIWPCFSGPLFPSVSRREQELFHSKWKLPLAGKIPINGSKAFAFTVGLDVLLYKLLFPNQLGHAAESCFPDLVGIEFYSRLRGRK